MLSDELTSSNTIPLILSVPDVTHFPVFGSRFFPHEQPVLTELQRCTVVYLSLSQGFRSQRGLHVEIP